jgi:hypothetical protein
MPIRLSAQPNELAVMQPAMLKKMLAVPLPTRTNHSVLHSELAVLPAQSLLPHPLPLPLPRLQLHPLLQPARHRKTPAALLPTLIRPSALLNELAVMRPAMRKRTVAALLQTPINLSALPSELPALLPQSPQPLHVHLQPHLQPPSQPARHKKMPAVPLPTQIKHIVLLNEVNFPSPHLLKRPSIN